MRGVGPAIGLVISRRHIDKAVLPGGAEVLSRLFRLDRIGDEAQFARVLSLEYALRRYGARVRTDF